MHNVEWDVWLKIPNHEKSLKKIPWKNTIKRATQVCGHSLKLHFCMFEKSQRKHNSLDYHFFWKYFPLITKFICSMLDTNKKYFCMFKALKPRKWTIFNFFKHSFFLPNVHRSFFKLERILTLMIRRAKNLELMKLFFITDSNTFVSNMFLTFIIMDLENATFNKSYSYLCDRGHGCIIYKT